MKVLYISQHFESENGLTRPYELAKKLTEEGTDVTMLTGKNMVEKELDGIQIVSTRTSYDHTFAFHKRLFAFFLFVIKSIYFGLKEKNVDLIYASSAPITVGITALIISKIKRVPFLFEVRDVWPDAPIEMGIIRNKVCIKLIRGLEKMLYQYASHVVALSAGIKRNIVLKGIDKNKVSVITNLAHCDKASRYVSECERNHIEMQYPELIGKTIALYPGTFGAANDLSFLLDVATQHPDSNIHYILIGRGKEKAAIAEAIKQRGLTNIWLLDNMSKVEVFKWMSASDVGIVNLANVPILAAENSSNKFFDFLSLSKPIILNFKGWQDDLLQEYNAGAGFDYDDKAGYYTFLKAIHSDKTKALAMGKRARILAETHFDARILKNQFAELIKSYEVNEGYELN
ncbi:glycosyltransferase family 4 protein [Listeria rocourtiae]|uniref:glycosyltransferase family 4 protein n=1 Tax=Listeria rocourtiae TaxID=647910 RepID=UPI0016244E32|nr:glycosyltransferase family 4 protein [Listeria rocourtiae]MBC1435202.1 glycosyltransferase family 4 protein [Listeria rocourtiae]